MATRTRGPPSTGPGRRPASGATTSTLALTGAPGCSRSAVSVSLGRVGSPPWTHDYTVSCILMQARVPVLFDHVRPLERTGDEHLALCRERLRASPGNPVAVVDLRRAGRQHRADRAVLGGRELDAPAHAGLLDPRAADLMDELDAGEDLRVLLTLLGRGVDLVRLVVLALLVQDRYHVHAGAHRQGGQHELGWSGSAIAVLVVGRSEERRVGKE